MYCPTIVVRKHIQYHGAYVTIEEAVGNEDVQAKGGSSSIKTSSIWIHAAVLEIVRCLRIDIIDNDVCLTN